MFIEMPNGDLVNTDLVTKIIKTHDKNSHGIRFVGVDFYTFASEAERDRVHTRIKNNLPMVDIREEFEAPGISLERKT